MAFDRHLWELAKTDPEKAAQESAYGGVHYRTGAPRIGEPIFRTPEDAALDQRNMYCGRHTGHFGTGLYFFGTLSAAFKSGAVFWAGTPGVRMAQEFGSWEEVRLREEFRHVWAVGVSSLQPPSGVADPREWRREHDHIRYLFEHKQVLKYHDFARALMCYPAYRADVVRLEAQVAAAKAEETAWDKAYDEAETEEEEETADRLMWAAREEYRRLRSEWERKESRLRRYTFTIDWDSPSHEPVPERAALAYKPLAPRAEVAINRYLDDIKDRRFPGYHPMTYYMRSIGVAAIIHRDWSEHNSGGIGNIWYPEVGT